jgi:type I restriction enzyme, R subunit
LPLLEFGREREGIYLSQVVLTHHNLRSQGNRQVPLSDGEGPKLNPLTESGGGSAPEKKTTRLAGIITRANDLFEGELTEDDRLVHVKNVIRENYSNQSF